MRKMSVFLSSIVFLGLAEQAFCAGPVFDAQNFARAFEILKEAKQHTEQARNIHREMSSMNSNIGSIKHDATRLKSDLLKWQTYYDGIDTLDSKDFSAFSWLGLDSLSPSNYSPETAGFVGNKFNSKQAMEDVNYQMFDDEQHPEEIKYRRQRLTRNSISTSIVASNESKGNLKKSKEKISEITAEYTNAGTTNELLLAQNKLLTVVASKLVKIEELEAQQLELLSSFFANFEGTSKLTDPSKRQPFKTKWD